MQAVMRLALLANLYSAFEEHKSENAKEAFLMGRLKYM